MQETKLEYTTEQIRQELAEKEALLKSSGLITPDPSSSNSIEHEINIKTEATISNDTTIVEEQTPKLGKDEPAECDDPKSTQNTDIAANDYQKSNTKDTETTIKTINPVDGNNDDEQMANPKEPLETKSKKKRRKKSMMKKKASLTTSTISSTSIANVGSHSAPPTRKSSSSSSAGSASDKPDQNEIDADPNQQSSNATSASIDDLAKSEAATITAQDTINETSVHEPMETPRMCEYHFFSDTEVAASPYGSRPSTPIQSDSELEISQRDSLVKNEKNSDPMSSSTASWKWGEFPITPAKTDSDTNCLSNKEAKQAERNSTIQTMISFMKETMKLRKPEGVYLSELMDTEGVDPSILAKYFPPTKDQSFTLNDGDDHESGNGTSLPHSPSSLENGGSKSIEFDFDNDGKTYDK